MDNDQFPEGKTRTEPGARLVIPSPGWLCWPFSPALSSSGFHGNMLFLVFSSLPVSVWRTDLYSFVQPWVTASVSSLLTLASIYCFTAASLLLLPKPVSQSGRLDPFVTIPLGRRKDVPSHVFKVNFSVLQSCSSSANHTTIHQTAQDRNFAIILSSPLLLLSQCQEALRPVTSASVLTLHCLLSIANVTTPGWATTICFLDYCTNLLTGFSASNLASFQSSFHGESSFKYD